jgi:uncharacterized protein
VGGAQLVAALPAVAVGLLSGVLSGMFGIGGGIISTPAIRLILGYPALVAVGTPLLVIVPTTITGAWSYDRAGLADVRAGLIMGAFGVPTAVLGALATRYVGGTIVLLLTAALILYTAVDVLWHAWRSPRSEPVLAPEEGEEPVLAGGTGDATAEPVPDPASAKAPSMATWALLGIVTGAYSGFLGLGGGFVLVPLLQRLAHMPVKRAIGTSLVAISILAIPGVLTHWTLGHIDAWLAVALLVGSVPGALIGARITRASRDRTVRVGFAVLLLVVGVWLAVAEVIGLGR